MQFRNITTLILYTLIIILFGNCLNFKKNKKIVEKENWIKFEWNGDTIGKRYFEKTSINIPFSIDGIPHKFKSQFDLGAFCTMVYGNSIEPYLEKYPEFDKKLDTINKKYWLQGKNVGAFKNVDVKLDDIYFKNRELVHFDKFGDTLTKDSLTTKTIKKIGTIGSDLFKNKFLIIDFPNERIQVLENLTENYISKTTFINIKIDKGRIKVPIKINNQEHLFMFDTGSSMFPLIVLKNNIKEIGNPEFAIDTIKVSSWGEYFNVKGYKINSNISIGNLKIDTKNLNIYDCKKEFKQFFNEEKIMGIMGNSFFLDKLVIIDFKNKKFGILK